MSSHFIAVANNDKWPDPAADGVMGPFTKLKKANGKPCLAEMDETNNCEPLRSEITTHLCS